MSDRPILVFWDCSCPQTIGVVPPVETKCTSADKFYDEEDHGWIIYLGFVERCSRCKKLLGDWYGDPYFFDTEQEADDFKKSVKIGEWK